MSGSTTSNEAKRRIGGYRIIAPIGVGSSSTVYRGLDEQSGQEVAIKVLADNHSLLPEMRQRFLDEIEMLAAVDSDSIAAVYELGETDSGQPFMVLELADRGDLRQRLEDLRLESQKLFRADLLALGHHLMTSLTTLHNSGIVHRDISPGNILIQGRQMIDAAAEQQTLILEADERFLLADLGLAKDLQYASGLTVGGGTKGFAAPEQQDEVTVVDLRADIFSATALVEWAAQTGGLTAKLDPFLERGLADDPTDRYDTMEAWFDGLHRCLDPDSAPLRSLPSHRILEPVPNPLVQVRKVAGLVGAGGLVVAMVVAAAAITFSRSDNDGSQATGTRQTIIATDDGPEPESAEPIQNEEPTSPVLPDNSAETTPTAIGNNTSVTSGAPISVTPSAVQTTRTAESNATAVSTTASSPTSATASTSPPPTVGSTTRATTSTTRATTSTTARATTTTRTTAGPTTRSTLAPTTSLVSEANSVRAYVRSPQDGAIHSGALTISGDAVGPNQGIARVRMVVKNLDTDEYWNSINGVLQVAYFQIAERVSTYGGKNVTWSYSIGAGRLTPGTYRVRVWADGVNGASDPQSNEIRFIVE